MKFRLLPTLILLCTLVLGGLLRAPLAFANDNCCGFNGQNCSSDQEWQNGWQACQNNQCPGYAGCAVGSGGGSSSNQSSGQESSGSNICGPGGAQGCTGKPVGYIMTAGSERLKCFKHKPTDATCGRQYVDANGNYTSGSDNTTHGQGNTSSSGGGNSSSNTNQSSAVSCAPGSADLCDGEPFNTIKAIPGSSSLIQCVKRQNSDRCKRIVVENNATQAQITAALPGPNDLCAGPQSQCRDSNHTCRQNNNQGQFRCRPTVTSYRLSEGTTSWSCQQDNNCAGNSCFSTRESCEEERVKRQYEKSCAQSKGKVLTCGSQKHCINARLDTTCAELEFNTNTTSPSPEELKKLCQQAGKSRLEECLPVIITENGVCDGNKICANNLECLPQSGSTLRRCQRPPPPPALEIGHGARCIGVGSTQNCICKIGVLSMRLNSGDSRVCSPSLFQTDENQTGSLYAQVSQVCTESLSCDPTKKLVCLPAPKLPAYEGHPAGTRVCLVAHDENLLPVGSECSLGSDGSSGCATGLFCLLDPARNNNRRVCVHSNFIETDIHGSCGVGRFCAEGMRCQTKDGRKVCVPGDTQKVVRYRSMGLNQGCRACEEGVDGTDCRYTSEQACIDANSSQDVLKCRAKGSVFDYCHCPGSAQGGACVVFAPGICTAYCAAARSNQVGPGEMRYKLALHSNTCQKCGPGESYEHCPFSERSDCDAAAEEVRRGTRKLPPGSVCETPEGVTRNSWCQDGYLCSRDPNGSSGPATCRRDDEVLYNQSCSQNIEGVEWSNENACGNSLRCMYDGAAGTYLCKRPDETPTLRSISPTDTQRYCLDELGCQCQKSNGAFEKVFKGEECPAPSNAQCSPEAYPGSICGDLSDGRCVYLDDQDTLTCSPAAFHGGFKNTGASTECSTRLCHCGGNPNNINTTYCALSTEQSCHDLCTEVSRRNWENIQAQLENSTFFQNLQKSLSESWRKIVANFGNIGKSDRVDSVEEGLETSSTVISTQADQASISLLPRGERCSVGSDCQSGICAQTKKGTAAFNTAHAVCLNFSDLEDDGATCRNDAACQSARCEGDGPIGTRTCQSSTYQSPQILAGTKCESSQTGECLCRLPSGATVPTPVGGTCFVPMNSSCSVSSQCGPLEVCAYSATEMRNICQDNRSNVIQERNQTRLQEALTQGVPVNATGTDCRVDSSCVSGLCVALPPENRYSCVEYDQLLPAGESCTTDMQCRSQSCRSRVCAPVDNRSLIWDNETCDSEHGCVCRADEGRWVLSIDQGELCTID